MKDKLNYNLKETAYILGYLWADGYVRSMDNGIVLSIIHTDYDQIQHILYKTSKLWKYRPLKPKKNSHSLQARLTLYCKNIHDELVKLGYIEKSRISPSKVLNFLKKELLPYWWRGYFDGDGGFHIDNGVSLYGSYEQNWSEFYKLAKMLGIKKYHMCQRIRSKGKGSAIHIFRKEYVKKFMDFIYQGKFFGLLRKRNLYKLMLKIEKDRRLKRFSQFIGVYKGKQKGKFRSQVKHRSKLYNIGQAFSTELEAALAYDKFVKRKGLAKIKKLNFPNKI